MIPNRRPIMTLAVMLCLALAAGALANRDRAGGLLSMLDEIVRPAKRGAKPASTDAPIDPPAQSPPPVSIATIGILPWEPRPGEPEPVWRQHAWAALLAIVPELAAKAEQDLPETARGPIRPDEEVAAERAQATEKAEGFMAQISPGAVDPIAVQPSPAPPPPMTAQVLPAQTGKAQTNRGKSLEIADAAFDRLLSQSKTASSTQGSGKTTGQAQDRVAAKAVEPAAPKPVSALANIGAPATAASVGNADAPLQVKTAVQTQPAAATAAGPEGPQAKAASGQISSVAMDCGPGECLLRIETTGQVERVTHFQKIQPARLAVDLHGSWTFRGPNVMVGNQEFVERIRLGAHQDRFRLVIDFKGDPDNTRKEPVIEKRGNTLLVKIAK